jgi:hypothetical protein
MPCRFADGMRRVHTVSRQISMKFEDPSLIDADYSWISVHVSKIDQDDGRQGLEMTGFFEL